MSPPVQVVLLDLGGVLLKLHDPVKTFDLNMPRQDFLETWLLSPAVRQFERGAIETSQFAADIVAEFTLPYTAAEFLRRFEAWPGGVYEGVPELLETIARGQQVALLSNTNEVHWNRDDVAGCLAPLLQKVFLSYETGVLKPDPDAFTDVLKYFGVAATAVLFLDDNPLNVAAARRCGMQSRLTHGVAGLTKNLEEAGISTTLG